MSDKSNEKLTPYARKLRKEMTKEERKLWFDYLKDFPFRVHRQKVIGSYIVDFYCANAELVIEIDGSQHYSQEGMEADRQRDAYLRSIGLTVLRYSNADVNDRFEAVCEEIWSYVYHGL